MDNLVVVEVTCRWCGNTHYVKMYESDFDCLNNGTKRVSDLRYLTAAERELFISRTCGDCWDEMFSDDED